MYDSIALLTADSAVDYVTAFVAALNTAAESRGINLLHDSDARDMSLDVMTDEAVRVIGGQHWTVRDGTLFISRVPMRSHEDFETAIDQMIQGGRA